MSRAEKTYFSLANPVLALPYGVILNMIYKSRNSNFVAIRWGKMTRGAEKSPLVKDGEGVRVDHKMQRCVHFDKTDVLGADASFQAERALPRKHAFPGVLVDARLEILQFYGDTSPYLAPAPGKLSFQLLKMAREGLLYGLREVVRRAMETMKPSRTTGLWVKSIDDYRQVDVEVIPVPDYSRKGCLCLIVLFNPVTHTLAQLRDTKADEDKRDEPIVTRMKRELVIMREHLESVIEQQGMVNEALHAAHVEAQTANEELQVINEELETSEAELLWTNKELANVNTELAERNVTLGRANSDLTNLFISVDMPIVMLGADLRIRRVTPLALRMLNLISTDVGRPIGDIQLNLAAPELESLLKLAMETGNTVERDVQDSQGHWYLQRIQPYRAPDDQIDGAILVFIDVNTLKQAEERLSYDAAHDALTGLVNRREFERRLERAVKNRGLDDQHALLCLDLDHFKIVNDTCGHLAGDELLRQLTVRMAQCVRKRDTLARLGGDEFGVLLEHCSPERALRVAHGLRQAILDYRFTWRDRSFMVSGSIGVTPIPQGGDTIGAVLAAADSACYAAKDEGGNQVCFYAAGDQKLTQRRSEMQWATRLNEALANNQFQLYVQPVLSLGVESGAGEWGEILLRLNDTDGELVTPAAFIAAAERYQRIRDIDRWVIKRAFALLAARERGAGDVYSINISGQSLSHESFLEFVLAQLEETLVSPTSVCFEITETAVIANLDHAKRFISALRARGCQFALDDFGSGLSSFRYLKVLPVDYLKIDGAFITEMLSDPLDEAVVKAIVQVCREIKVRTIAESVETSPLIEHLRGLHVDYAQGYAVAAPRPLE